MRWCWAVVLVCACSSPAVQQDAGRPDAPIDRPDAGPDGGAADAGRADGGTDAGRPTFRVGPLTPLPLLEGWDAGTPPNHSAEVTVAARDGKVVAAFINMRFARADTFETTNFRKRVAVVTSADRGETWSKAIDPEVGDQTTDPVVRASADGSFWLATWDTDHSANSFLSRSRDDGRTWRPVAEVRWGDKQWLAVDDARGFVWAGAIAGQWKFDLDGGLLAFTDGGRMQMAGGYADERGAHFVGLRYQRTRWGGQGQPNDLGRIRGSDGGQGATSVGFGRAHDGQPWLLRTVEGASGGARVALWVGEPGTGVEVELSSAGAQAFMPAGAIDGSGRLHAIWYESDGPVGVLKYARSKSADLTAGFSAPLVIDDQACPGGRWYPFFSSAEGGRRLREYVDVAVDGNRAHLAWTHAPTAPSRVFTTYVEFDPP